MCTPGVVCVFNILSVYVYSWCCLCIQYIECVCVLSGWLRLYKIFQEAAPPVSDLRLMCHLLNNCSLYMSIIFIYFLSIYIGNN